MDLRHMKVLIRGSRGNGFRVAVRLHRSHFRVLMTEIDQPLCVRRGRYTYTEALFDGSMTVEGVRADRTDSTIGFRRGKPDTWP
jgi:hypothetical protein